jgi:hypothetical protein
LCVSTGGGLSVTPPPRRASTQGQLVILGSACAVPTLALCLFPLHKWSRPRREPRACARLTQGLPGQVRELVVSGLALKVFVQAIEHLELAFEVFAVDDRGVDPYGPLAESSTRPQLGERLHQRSTRRLPRLPLAATLRELAISAASDTVVQRGEHRHRSRGRVGLLSGAEEGQDGD